jgi:hypothetical protein
MPQGVPDYNFIEIRNPRHIAKAKTPAAQGDRGF